MNAADTTETTTTPTSNTAALVSFEEVMLWQDLEEREMVTIPIPGCISNGLTLRQYVSADDRWGIHSSIWEGGLALLAYLHRCYFSMTTTTATTTTRMTSSSSYPSDTPKSPLFLDLGSGTGIVGLGMAKLGYHVLLTDLEDALPLLQENKQRNCITTEAISEVGIGIHVEDDTEQRNGSVDSIRRQVNVCNVTWGQPLSQDVVYHITNTPHVILVGADIVYRPSLFEPLLKTVHELFQYPSVDAFLLASHSIRTHLHDFYQQLQTNPSWTVRLVATVTIPEDDKTNAVAAAQIELIPSLSLSSSSSSSSSDLSHAPQQMGLVHIVKVERRHVKS